MQYRFGAKFISIPALILLILLFQTAVAFAGHGEAKKEKTGILLVAFGSTMPEAQVSFEKIDERVRSEFPDVDVRWAYTSSIIREKMAGQGTDLDSPALALSKMMDEGFTHVAVQSLHTIPGEEYEGLVDTAESFEGMPKGIDKISIGTPLLYSDADMRAAVSALKSVFPSERKDGDSIILMGHGTHHAANIYYPASQYYFELVDPNVYVGTVEGSPSLDDIMKELKSRKKGRVFLMPFMSVAGDHARNDMAGNESDSWKSILSEAGYDCIPVLKGTAEVPAVLDIWVDHLKTAYSELKH